MTTIRTIALCSIVLAASCQADIFDDPQNLKVLPKDISAQELRATMRGFAMGLGVRCETCHVGEDPSDLQTFDFAADDKEEKLKARIMLKMLTRINGELLSPLDEFDGQRLEVQCVTCHRGQRKPKLTAQALGEVYESDGLGAALQTYDDLRRQYYGSHTYDFSETVLTEYAGNLARQGQADASIAFLKKNTEHYPDSMMTWFTMGEVYKLTGDTANARSAYERALEINPQAGFIRQRLDSLE